MFDYSKIQQQVIESIEGSGCANANDFDLDSIMDELRDRGIESIEDIDSDEFWAIVADNTLPEYESIEDLQLNTLAHHELKLGLIPTPKDLYYHCIQDVLRDYATVADWRSGFYARYGAEARDMTDYKYGGWLIEAFADCIKKNI